MSADYVETLSMMGNRIKYDMNKGIDLDVVRKVNLTIVFRIR